MAITLIACEKTAEERALDLVTDGIKRSADDPSSVQDVKLTFLKKKQEAIRLILMIIRLKMYLDYLHLL